MQQNQSYQFYTTHASSWSKPGTYVTHNATQPPTDSGALHSYWLM